MNEFKWHVFKIHFINGVYFTEIFQNGSLIALLSIIKSDHPHFTDSGIISRVWRFVELKHSG